MTDDVFDNFKKEPFYASEERKLSDEHARIYGHYRIAYYKSLKDDDTILVCQEIGRVPGSKEWIKTSKIILNKKDLENII